MREARSLAAAETMVGRATVPLHLGSNPTCTPAQVSPQPPFAITAISEELPLVFNNTYRGRTAYIAFVSGLDVNPQVRTQQSPKTSMTSLKNRTQ